MTEQRKLSVTIRGHRTSVSLERPFLNALNDIAGEIGISINELITRIDEGRVQSSPPVGLSSAIRVFVLEHYRNKSHY